MEMEELQKELEEMRSAMEKLSSEHRAKSVLSESLRRAHGEQLARLQEAKAEIVKQAGEIDAKAVEISLARQMYEDLKSSFSQKESVVRHLSLANESLKSSFREEAVSWEVRNKELVSALDEANAKGEERERMMCSYRKEIEQLKGLLLLSQRKCSDAEKRAQAPKDLSRRDEVLFELEQEKGRVEDQLKWKSEQFRHLEEAHSKIQDEFRVSKKEWERERSNLFDEINTLQMNLDSQNRVADDLRSQLQMCNQALAHEESRRKLLEFKISESKALYENVVMEYEEARSNIEALTTRRDEEVAALRISLATKVTLLKETEFSRTHLELENQELRESLKELRGTQINGVDAAASLKNLRPKFRALEQAHRDCSEKLKAREVEWTTRTSKLGKDLDECLAKLISKDNQIWELQVELEGSYASLMQQKMENEEISIVSMVLESKLLESCSNLEKPKVLEWYSASDEERIAVLMEQVEKKNGALVQAQAEIKRERETADSLQTKIDYLESIEQEYFLTQKELDSYKGMFEESSRNVDLSSQQESQKVNDLQEDLKKASDALDQANSALSEKTNEMHKVEAELQQLKTVVERMENFTSNLEIELAKYRGDSDELRRGVEASFLARMEAEKALVEEKDRFHRITEEKDKIIEELQRQIVLMEKEFARREFEAATLAKLATEKENRKLLQIAEDVDKKIKGVNTKLDFLEQKYEEAIVEASMNLEQLSLEREFTRSVETAGILKLAEKQFETDTVYEALEKIVTVHILDEQEIQYKRIVIGEMEEEIVTLQMKLVAEEKESFDLKDCIDRLKIEKITERSERDRETVQVENELKSMRSNKRALEGQIAQLLLEKEELAGLMRGFSDLIGEVYQNDKELMRNWERVVKKAKSEDTTVVNFEGKDLFSCHKAGHNSDRRSPLKEYNY